MCPLRAPDRLSTLETTFLERLNPESLWKRIQDEGEVKFPADRDGSAGCLIRLVGGHIWLVLFAGLLGVILVDWQKFGLDLTRLLPEIGTLIALALMRWHVFLTWNYQLVLRASGADIVAEEQLVRVRRKTIRLMHCLDAVPAGKGGVTISFKDGERVLIGKHLDLDYSKIVADFFKFMIAEIQPSSAQEPGKKLSEEGVNSNRADSESDSKLPE